MTEPFTVLLVGNGGRESALARKMRGSPLVSRIIVAPGNGGFVEDDCWPVQAHETDKLAGLARAKQAGLVLVGPEAPLIAGLADTCRGFGIPTFGPSKAASILEGSKIFTHEMCRECGIPKARGFIAESVEEARTILRYDEFRVVKADGLRAGKGVVVGRSYDTAALAVRDFLEECTRLGEPPRILIEELLSGRECTMQFFCDGKHVIRLIPSGDQKCLSPEPDSPNTGGMGAYAPLADVDAAIEDEVHYRMIVPTLRYMRARGTPFMGLLNANLMLTPDGPKLMEFNVRFGDPETQVVLPLIEDDIVPYLLACTKEGGLAGLPELRRKKGTAVCTVMVSNGYPGPYTTGYPISLPIESADAYVLHAGTIRDGDVIRTDGGRVVNAIGLGETVAQARERSLQMARDTHFDGAYFRTDIGKDA